MVRNLLCMFKVSIQEYHKDLIQHIRDKTPLSDIIPFETVLKRFIQAIVDMSINEKSVHFMNSTDIEFDSLYNKFESVLTKEWGSFIKTALEVGYKAKHLKVVYSTFEEYSTTIKSLIPAKSQKEFEKNKAEIIIKFIRFIICTRIKQFATFDYSKIEKKWNPSLDHAMKKEFDVQNSMFLKNFYKAVDDKYDRSKFEKYWFMMLGKDTNLLITFYDNSLLSYDRLLKAFSQRDEKIRNYKHKASIKLPADAQEMATLSLTNSNSFKLRELMLFDDSECKCQEDDEMSGPFDFSRDLKKSHVTRSCAQQWPDKKYFDIVSESAEDKETQDCSDNMEICNEFTQLFKKQCMLEKTRSMKRNEVFNSFRSYVSSGRKASM